MSTETESEEGSSPTRPALHQRVGRVVHETLRVMGGDPGRRGYDKKRIALLLTLLATVQFCVQLGGRLIQEMFQAYDKAVTRAQTTEMEQRAEQHHEMLAAMKAQTDALKELAVKIEENTNADAEMRTAFWTREGIRPAHRAKTGGHDK